MKITGKITKAVPVKTGMSKKGGTWAVQQYVLDAGEEGTVLLELFGQKEIDSLAITEGETLTVTFTPKVTEYGDKCFGRNNIVSVERPRSEDQIM